MFPLLFRLLGSFKELSSIISAFIEEVPEIDALLKLFSYATRPSVTINKEIAKILKSLTPQKIQKVQGYLKKILSNGDFEKLFKQKIQEHYGSAVNASKLDLANVRINLSSSWLSYGVWFPEYQLPSGENYGTLSWATQSGYGPYDTPNISGSVWQAMVLSTNHAGTIGWKLGVFNAVKSQKSNWP